MTRTGVTVSIIFKKSLNEYFITVSGENNFSFDIQVKKLFENYFSELENLGLSLNTCVYVNIYLSDSANQEDYVREHKFYNELLDASVAISVLELPPLISKISMLAYHLKDDNLVKELKKIDGAGEYANALYCKTDLLNFYILKNFTNSSSLSMKDQTEKVLNSIYVFCENNKLSIFDSLVRTWVYVNNIDSTYTQMTKKRRALFSSWNFSQNTRFPASTGIGGRNKNSENLLIVDAIVLDGIKKEQIKTMTAPTHMNSTFEYGVTFERGLHIKYEDRNHYYISGTASIDNRGDVINKGDVVKQLARLLENIEVLLKNSGSYIDELAYYIIYVRDVSDIFIVKEYIKQSKLSNIPHLFLRAKVCRPAWLIEVDAMAIG